MGQDVIKDLLLDNNYVFAGATFKSRNAFYSSLTEMWKGIKVSQSSAGKTILFKNVPVVTK